jgi:drug/metabolite transporter (DMT)-like permease
MIQRIQSIYLLLSGLSLGGLFFSFGTLAHLKDGSTVSRQLALEDGVINLADNNFMMIFTFAAIALVLFAIFFYRNRPMQTKIVALGMVLAFVIFAIGGWLLMQNSKIAGNDLTIDFGLASPVLSVIFGFLANKSIRKDIALVKSMDRLR